MNDTNDIDMHNIDTNDIKIDNIKIIELTNMVNK